LNVSDESVLPAVPRAALRGVAWFWLALLIVASLQPIRPVIVKSNHRPLHYVAFAGAAFLLYSLSRKRRREIQGALAIFLLCFALEFLQHLIYRTHFEWTDVVDDGVAILAAYVLYRLSGAWKPQ
jgi:hypothetical protein